METPGIDLDWKWGRLRFVRVRVQVPASFTCGGIGGGRFGFGLRGPFLWMGERGEGCSGGSGLASCFLFERGGGGGGAGFMNKKFGGPCLF